MGYGHYGGFSCLSEFAVIYMEDVDANKSGNVLLGAGGRSKC